MTSQLAKHRIEVTGAALRLDAALAAIGTEARGVRKLAKSLSPALLLGVGLVGGFLLVLLPRRLRSSAMISIGQFVLTQVLEAFGMERNS